MDPDFKPDQKRLNLPGKPNVTYPVQGREPCDGYLSPVNPNSEYGLVLLQEWWGLNQSLMITADIFARLGGWRILVPDVYRGKVGIDRETAGHLKEGLDWNGATADINAAKDYLLKNGCKKVGIIGFCMGGALCLATSASYQGFDAVAPFYGVPDLKKYDLSKITCKFQGHYAQKDAHKGFSDVQTAKQMFEQVKKNNPDAKLFIWQGAEHSFMNQDNPRYHKVSFDLAMEELKKLFQ